MYHKKRHLEPQFSQTEDRKVNDLEADLDAHYEGFRNSKIVDTATIETQRYSGFEDIVLTRVGNSFFINGDCLMITKGFAEAARPNILSSRHLEIATLESMEVAFSCMTKDTASSSPSMMLHQLALFTLIKLLRVNVAVEEKGGAYTPDLVIDVGGGNLFHIDICSSVTWKDAELTKRGLIHYACVNKYNLIRPWNKDLAMLLEWSKAVDTRNTEFFYSKVLVQASGSEMIYSKRVLDFLMKDSLLTFRDNRDKAKEALKICTKESMRSMRKASSETVNSSAIRILDAMENALDGKYKPITFSNIGSGGSLDVTETENYFEEITVVRVRDKFYDGVVEDMQNIIQKDAQDFSNSKWLSEFLVDMELDKLSETYLEVASSKMGLIRGKERMSPADKKRQKVIKTKDRDTSLRKMVSTLEPMAARQGAAMAILDTPILLDPDHKEILDGEKLSKLADVLSKSREYHDLRWRSRISKAIYTARRPETKIRVNHWFNSEIYAEVYIRGLILASDKGLAFVSFFDSGELVRTEKWHLTEVTNYNKNANVLVTSASAYVNNTISEEPSVSLKDFVFLTGLILSENSWTVGSFLKPFRYWCTGVLFDSNLVGAQADKVISSICNENRSKFSLRVIKNMLRRSIMKAGGIVPGKTPLFNLSFANVGFECFLINYTPSDLYGRKKHAKDCLTDLRAEIIKANESFDLVKTITKDFERIISLENSTVNDYILHLGLIESVAQRTDFRFTLSPVSVLIISEELDKINKNLFQGTVPHVKELLTTKASWDPDGMEGKSALEAMSVLIDHFGTSSTSLIGLKILDSANPIDFYMRIFGKDQFAENREISIMSNVFRILQSITESFAKTIGRETGVDMLANPMKMKHYCNMTEEALARENGLLLTMDQTKWGPNFNTALFGWMFAYLTRLSTEAFIPMLVCLLGEFKVFGCPLELIYLLGSIDTIYSGPGWLGRFHMGQGIFHYCSSLYHSMVNCSLMASMKDVFNESRFAGLYEINNRHIVTSDDVAMVIFFVPLTDVDAKNAQLLNWARIYIENMFKFYMVFSIKPSSYKNIISETMIEFNSVYLTKNCIASNDVKFTNSLLINQTSGSLWLDFQMSINSYGDCINSGCSKETSRIIMRMNVYSCFTRWRIKSREFYIEDSYELYGFPKFRAPIDPTLTFGDCSRLHFKKRDRLKDSYKSVLPLDFLFRPIISQVANSKVPGKYRALFVPSMKKWDRMLFNQSKSVLTDMEEPFTLLADALLPECLMHRKNVSNYYNTDNDRPMEEQCYEAEVPNEMFFVKKFVVSSVRPNVFLELFTSGLPQNEKVNCNSSCDDLILHMLRKHRILSIEPTTESISDYYSECLSRVEAYTGGNIQQICCRVKEPFPYYRYVQITDPEIDKRKNSFIFSLMYNTSFASSNGLLKTSSEKYFGTLNRRKESRHFILTTISSMGKSMSGISMLANVSIIPDVSTFITYVKAKMEEEPKRECYIKVVTKYEMHTVTDISQADFVNIMMGIEDNESEQEVKIKETSVQIYYHKTRSKFWVLSADWLRKTIMTNILLDYLIDSKFVERIGVWKEHSCNPLKSLLDSRVSLQTADRDFCKKFSSYVDKMDNDVPVKRDSREAWKALALFMLNKPNSSISEAVYNSRDSQITVTLNKPDSGIEVRKRDLIDIIENMD